MSNIEWAFPGPEPYTYMHASPEFFGITTKDPHELGKEYVKHLMLWRMGIEAGKKVDVTPSQGVDTSLAERNLKAQPMEFERGNRTPEEAEKLVQEALGATVVESDAPWNNKGMTLTAEKPWEKKTSTIDIDI